MSTEHSRNKLKEILNYSLTVIKLTLLVLTSSILLSCADQPTQTKLEPLDITGKAVGKTADYYQTFFRDRNSEKIYVAIDHAASGSYHYAGTVFAVEEFKFPPLNVLPNPGLPVAMNIGGDAIPTVIFKSGGTYTACEYSSPGWSNYSIQYDDGPCKPFNIPPQLPAGSELISINTGQNVAATSYYLLPNGDYWKMYHKKEKAESSWAINPKYELGNVTGYQVMRKPSKDLLPDTVNYDNLRLFGVTSDAHAWDQTFWVDSNGNLVECTHHFHNVVVGGWSYYDSDPEPFECSLWEGAPDNLINNN